MSTRCFKIANCEPFAFVFQWCGKSLPFGCKLAVRQNCIVWSSTYCYFRAIGFVFAKKKYLHITCQKLLNMLLCAVYSMLPYNWRKKSWNLFLTDLHTSHFNFVVDFLTNFFSLMLLQIFQEKLYLNLMFIFLCYRYVNLNTMYIPGATYIETVSCFEINNFVIA